MIETPIQHLIVARHGDYDGSPRANPPLSERGRHKAARLGEAIFTIIGGRPISILCSAAKRTLETATLAGQRFGKKPVPDMCFWADDDYSPDMKKAMELVLACTTPVVLVVTHADVTWYLPRAFMKEVLEMHPPDITTASYGQAWHLNVTTKEVVKINR